MTVAELKEVFDTHIEMGMSYRADRTYRNENWLLETDWRRELADREGIRLTELEMEVMVDWLMALPSVD